jgi:hypothetical protein
MRRHFSDWPMFEFVLNHLNSDLFQTGLTPPPVLWPGPERQHPALSAHVALRYSLGPPVSHRRPAPTAPRAHACTSRHPRPLASDCCRLTALPNYRASLPTPLPHLLTVWFHPGPDLPSSAPRRRSPLKRASLPCAPLLLSLPISSLSLARSSPVSLPCLLVQLPMPEQAATGHIIAAPALSSPPPVSAALGCFFPPPRRALTIPSPSYHSGSRYHPLQLPDSAVALEHR